MKNLLRRTSVKTFILIVLTTLVSISIALLGDWKQEQNGFVLKVIFLAVSVILYLVASVLYAVYESNGHRVLSELERQNKQLALDLVNILYICKESSSDVSVVIDKANAQKVFDSKIWSFDKSCRDICVLIYNYIYSI